ncbi:MAG TPA: hypothetical protein VK900_11170 [Anaerolineales bacterium]|nr:hypothetical protein [Anaerolineales bacterium]
MSSQHAPEIENIDNELLTSLVGQLFNSPGVQITHREVHPIRYINTETSNLGLFRFRGTARLGEEESPWSLILKAVHAPVEEAEPGRWNYHRREILAYQQGLLSALPGGLQAPRCFGVTEGQGEVCWLWLEDIQDAAGPTWSLAEYGTAAHHLGLFNGAYAAGHPMPDVPWLSRNWVQGWVRAYYQGCLETLDVMREAGFWEQPLMRSAFPRSIVADTLRLWEHHEQLYSVLDRLPQTFCHMDAYRPNLFLRRDSRNEMQTVAVDWVFAGPGAIGEEAAQLFAGSLFWFEYDAADAQSLDEAIFTTYLQGLREAGWHGSAELVRLGYAAACALRWGVVGLWWLLTLADDAERAELESQWNRPMPELAEQFARITYQVLGMAEEAYELQRKL